MADINLKDEKRVSVNGEYDLVTTHPNNEPIYRSNGHELEFNASNSDYVDINESDVITNVSDIDIEVDFVLGDETSGVLQYLVEKGSFGSATNGYIRCYRDTSNNLVVQLRDKGSFYAQFSAPISEGFRYNLVIKNREFILNGSTIGTFVDTAINIDGSISFGASGFAGGNPSQFINASISRIKYQGETFNPTNINSNAQIVGSSATIAQVNSSAADPINYILGTVFQKSGFALDLVATNSDYIVVDEDAAVTTTADIDLEITFIPKPSLNFENLIFKGQSGNSNNTRYYINRFAISATNTAYTFNINDNLGTFSQNFVLGGNANTILDNVENTIKIQNREIFVNGVLKGTINDEVINVNDLFPLTIGARNDGIQQFDGSIVDFKYQGENYPLRRGLGVELIGSNGTTAEIKTSAANPQQRVNFGMWLKGDNINGWNPYTV